MKNYIVITILLLSTACSAQRFIPKVHIYCDQNTEQDLAGYKIHFFATSANDTSTITLQRNPSYIFFNILLYNTSYAFFITAFDSSGNESLPSETIFYFVRKDSIPPRHPRYPKAEK